MTNKLSFFFLSIVSACSSASTWMPLSANAPAPAQATLVWVGRGECERLENGKWVRRPEFDYDFNVEQHRYQDRWESVKSMRRNHPGYDGSAGPRTETMFFNLAVPSTEATTRAAAKSSLGMGDWGSDREFRRADLALIAANVSQFAPFDRYRITQHYDYEGGQLTEQVELKKGEQHWVRINEKASLFAARAFEQAPTRR